MRLVVRTVLDYVSRMFRCCQTTIGWWNMQPGSSMMRFVTGSDAIRRHSALHLYALRLHRERLRIPYHRRHVENSQHVEDIDQPRAFGIFHDCIALFCVQSGLRKSSVAARACFESGSWSSSFWFKVHNTGNISNAEPEGKKFTRQMATKNI